MSVSIIYLVRHGAHDRLGRVLCGRDHTSLNQEGRRQAGQLGEWFARLGADAVQTSPLVRATQTAAPIAEGTRRPLITAEALNEIDIPAWTGAAFPDLEGQPDWQWWNEDRGRRRPPGGETMTEVQVRIAAWLEGFRNEAITLVAVSHADIIKAAVCYVLGLPLDFYDRFEIDPGSVTTLIVADWGMKVQTMNERPFA